MAPKPQAEIEAAVKDELASTRFAVASLTPLSGGNANFVFRAELQTPLEDGTAQVAVKHGESYVALQPDFALGMTRCKIEQESLRLLSKLPPSTSPACAVATPKTLYFNSTTSTQIQEYLPNAVSLKNYALEHYAAPTPESLRPQCLQLGRCLGEWLRRFHDWSDAADNDEVRAVFAGNSEMQNIKKVINYDYLAQKVDKYPDILKGCEGMFGEIAEMAAAELADQDSLRVIHGDFWTGNVLIPNEPIQDGTQTPVRIVDWEMAELGPRPEDVGQMVAEMWQLKLYKGMDAGVWLIEGFADGYGPVDDAFAFRTIVHTGAHLIGFGASTPGWGTEKQAEGVVEVGRDVLLMAWRRDRGGFGGHDLGCLFS